MRLVPRRHWLAGLLMAVGLVVGAAGATAAAAVAVPGPETRRAVVDDAASIALRQAVRWCLGDPASGAPPSSCERRNDSAGDLNAGYDERAVWVQVALRRVGA
ncbi:MAG: hypothetical protein ACRC2H_04100, partial [Silanimonas sp.]